jgi:hypothetical protein
VSPAEAIAFIADDLLTIEVDHRVDSICPITYTIAHGEFARLVPAGEEFHPTINMLEDFFGSTVPSI